MSYSFSSIDCNKRHSLTCICSHGPDNMCMYQSHCQRFSWMVLGHINKRKEKYLMVGCEAYVTLLNLIFFHIKIVNFQEQGNIVSKGSNSCK